MNLDPFQSPGTHKSKSQDEIFVKSKTGGAGRRSAPLEPAEAMDMSPPEAAPEPEKKKLGAVLRNPQWQSAKVGFNEEAEVSADLELPEEHAHKTKVNFELFAKTPNGPERISQGEGVAKDGKAFCKIPVYIPAFKDEDGNRLEKVEYYFVAKHSEAKPLDGSKAPKLVDEMADRLVESHILPDINFATGSSFLHPKHAAELKILVSNIQEWQKKTPDGKLVIFGHADAVGKEESNKALSERRAQSVLAFLLKEPDTWEELAGKEKWGLAATQEYLFHLGYDPDSVDGQDGPKTKEAIKAFQTKQGVPQSGSADAATRKALFKAFIDKYNLVGFKKKDFDDINGNPFAGCSEFNLADKNKGASEANRRAGIFLLKSNKNFPITYPCAKGDIGPCKKQAARTGDRRTTGFNCLFYDKLIVERPNKGNASVIDKPEPKKEKRHIEIWCQHGKDGKKRIAREGQILEVVPKLASGDDLEAKGTGTGSESIAWRYGEEGGKAQQGANGKFEAGSIVNTARMLPKISDLIHLLKGEWDQIEGCHPKVEKVYARWEDGEEKEVTVKIFPHAKISHDLFERASEWKSAEETAEKMVGAIQKVFRYVDEGIKIEFERLKGKIEFEGGFEEDENSRLAYYKFSVSGGLKPIIGANINVPFRFPGDVLPEPLRKYVLRLNPSVSLKGSVDFSLGMERESYRYVTGKVELGGSIGVGVALNCKIFNGKLIEAKYEVKTGIDVTAAAKNFHKDLQDEDEKRKLDAIVECPMEVTFQGISGQLTFKIFSGKIDMGSEKLELIKAQKLLEKTIYFPKEKMGDA